MQFLEILAKSYAGAPWRVGAPPTRNPRSAPDCIAGDDMVSELLKLELLFKIYVGKIVNVRTYLSQIWQNLS